MTEPIISVSGLRGIVGQTLTPDVAMRYAIAFAGSLPPGPIVISRDGRTTGPMLADSLRAALCAVGRSVLDAGIAATPTIGVLVRQREAAGGIQISASHNPPEYNGLKLFAADGRIIPAAAGAAVLTAYRESVTPTWSSFDAIGTVEVLADTIGEHSNRISNAVDVDAIRRRKFKVLLDANHGAGSLLGRALLERLGCQCTVLGNQPDGHFAHVPEPTSENLASVLPLVSEMKADVGFCQDPDADRLAIIDENGRYVGEEYTLALCVDHVLRQRRGPIVTNCSTSRMSQDLAQKYGVPFVRSAVGEANVVDAMLARGAVLGGEGNGGVIDPRIGLVRDSFIGMALVLEAMAMRKLPVSKLVDELPKYDIVKSKITLARDKLTAGFDALEEHFANAICDRLDGLRLDWPDRWFLVRASNTEPIVRAFAEAPSAAIASRLCAEASDVLAQV